MQFNIYPHIFQPIFMYERNFMHNENSDTKTQKHGDSTSNTLNLDIFIDFQ